MVEATPLVQMQPIVADAPSVYMYVCWTQFVSTAKTSELIELPFVMWTFGSPRNRVLDGGLDPSPQERAFYGAYSWMSRLAHGQYTHARTHARMHARAHTHTHTHMFNGPFSGTTQVSRYQKGKTNLNFTEARDSEWQWHQLGHMQVCISLQTDNHASTPPLKFFYRPDALPAAQPTVSKH